MTKAGIQKNVQGLADATGNNDLSIALGAPGRHLPNAIGEIRPTGQAWLPEPKTWSLVVEGLARHDGLGREAAAVTDVVLSTDRRIELSVPNTVVTLPAAAPEFIGSYAIKSKGVAGGEIRGTVDGSVAAIPLENWDSIGLYCNGTEWLIDWFYTSIPA